MSYRDILVYVDTSRHADVRLATAAKLATRCNAHLTALYVDGTPAMPIELAGTAMAETVRQWQSTRRKEYADKVRALVDVASRRHGLSIELQEDHGNAEEAILAHACYADLIVVSQTGSPLDLSQPVTPSPGVLALSSGRPVLVVPNRDGDFSIGDNILVAWKAGAEAARAVHDAIPLLKAAAEVTLLEVSEEVKRPRRLIGAEMAHHLARHGANVSVRTIPASMMNDAPAVLEQVTESGADLIVMGAYGHSRLREVVMGGMTNHILKHHAVPLLLAH